MTENSTNSYRIYREKLQGPYHDFWLLQEGQHDYKDFWNLLGRKDAEVRISDDLLRYFYDTLSWIPTLNPSVSSQPSSGLNLYGPTIINHTGGQHFADVTQAWSHLLNLGPEQIVLSTGSMGIVGEDGEVEDKGWCKLEIERDVVVQQLNLLAEWGRSAATGEFFVLHLGI